MEMQGLQFRLHSNIPHACADLLKEHSKLIRQYFIDFISDYDFHQLTTTHEVWNRILSHRLEPSY